MEIAGVRLWDNLSGVTAGRWWATYKFMVICNTLSGWIKNSRGHDNNDEMHVGQCISVAAQYV